MLCKELRLEVLPGLLLFVDGLLMNVWGADNQSVGDPLVLTVRYSSMAADVGGQATQQLLQPAKRPGLCFFHPVYSHVGSVEPNM